MAYRDYEEFIAALNVHGVRYLVVGAHAVAFHAPPRATKGLDILIEPTAANARKVIAALREFFGGVEIGYSEQELTDPRWIIQLGVAPVRIDLMSEIPGFGSFDAAWKTRVDATFGGVPAHYIGLDELIRAKEAVHRPQDRADLRILERAQSGAPLTTRSSRRRKRTQRRS